VSLQVLVTGASGFIGRRLVPRLRKRGYDVTTLGRTATNELEIEHIGLVSYVRDALAEVVSGRRFDAVINLAAAGVAPGARDPRALHEVNAAFAIHLIELLRHSLRIVVSIGSNAEYSAAPPGVPLTETSALERSAPYGASKALGGMLALSAGYAYAVPVVHLRLFNVYGPGEPAHRLLPSLMRSFAAGESAALSLGQQQRDFVFVDDACGAIERALDSGAQGALAPGAYNVCSGVATSVRGFAEIAARIVGASADRLDFGALTMRTDELLWLVGDPTAFEQAAGWSARIDVAEGIGRTIALQRSQPVPTAL
jgi:nucleoside-diphosphate-sugar epimerase